MKSLRNAFMTGLLILVPLAATLEVILWLVNSIDRTARQFFPAALLPFDFHGLGVLLALTLIFLTGILARNYAGLWLVGLFDSLIRRMPFVGGIYGGIKKFLETILNPQSDKFHGTVLIEFPREGIYSIGFRTGQPPAKIPNRESKHLVNVFVPCTPNPTSGFYLMVPEESLIPLDMTVQQAFKNVISMGIMSDEEHHHK